MREAELIAELLTKPAPSAETVAAGRLRLRRESPRRRPSRGLLFGGGFTALVAGGVAAAVVVSGFGGPVPAEPPTDAATILLAAAERAETAPTGTGRYWHVRYFSSLGPSHGEPDDSGEGETWTTTDGRRWAKTRYGLQEAPSDGKFDLCGKAVTYRQITELPTEPNALRARLRRLVLHGDRNQAGFTTSCMAGLLAGQPTPPRVRAAAFRSLAGLSEAEPLGTQRDPAGRVGTALRIAYGDTWLKLLIDPTNSTILAWESGDQELVRKTVFYEVGWTDTPPA